jgi:Zn-finger nucleic acid-binding protein
MENLHFGSAPTREMTVGNNYLSWLDCQNPDKVISEAEEIARSIKAGRPRKYDDFTHARQREYQKRYREKLKAKLGE